MSEVSLMQQRTFGPETKLDKYGLGPIEVGSGAQSHDVQAVANLNTLASDLTRLGFRKRMQASELAAVRAEHIKIINAAEAAIATRESKRGTEVTQAEIDAQLESTLDPYHPLIRATRASTRLAQEHASLAAKIEAAKEAMIADGLIAKPAAK